jgi:predicted phosphodiesterase
MNLEADLETYRLIHQAIDIEKPDLIVITGDITMVFENERVLIQLRDILDSYHIPWTFVFGNHDYEPRLTLDEQANILMQGKYCLFEKGNPQLRGLGNYHLQLSRKGVIIAMLGFIDSHNERIDVINGQNVWSYDTIDQAQIDAFIKVINELKYHSKKLSSLFFFHIPLVEYKTELESNRANLTGDCFETVSCSKYDSHFFPQLLKTGTLKGIFVGHDHVDDFSFIKEGCLLAFGRCTGHYNYTMPEFKKGARIIDMDESGTISSHIFIE